MTYWSNTSSRHVYLCNCFKGRQASEWTHKMLLIFLKRKIPDWETWAKFLNGIYISFTATCDVHDCDISILSSSWRQHRGLNWQEAECRNTFKLCRNVVQFEFGHHFWNFDCIEKVSSPAELYEWRHKRINKVTFLLIWFYFNSLAPTVFAKSQLKF